MLDNRINITYMLVEELKPYPGNPRSWGEKETEDLKKSLKKFGFTQPLLVNTAPGRENLVLSGNFRLEVARELKIKEVPVVKVCIDDPEKEKELLLRMNVLNGDWNMELLKDWDVDIVLEAGFKEIDLSGIFDDSLETEDDGFDIEKELSEIKNPISKPGDLYSLGHHRLLCGDSLDEKSVEKLMREQLADAIYTDPPFNIQLDYNKGIGGKASYGGNVADNKTDEEYASFLKQNMKNALKFTKPDAHYFYYCDQSYVWLIQTLYKELGIKPVRTCLWIKNGLNPTPNLAFNKCYEPVVYGVRGKPYISPKCANLTEILNKEIATGNRQNDDLLDQLDIWMVKRLAGQDYTHPTEKPPTLHEKALRRCTKPGDIVLDLFGGSGSTLIACHQLKRKCYMVEKNPIFVDLILKRYETLTGEKPKLISGGRHGN